MKKTFKIIGIVLLIILFPIGMIYCIGKALFSDKRTFVTYLGMLFIFLVGFIVSFCIFRQDLVNSAIEWFRRLFSL